MKSGRCDYTVCFLFPTVPWVFVKKIKAVTMKYGCISHLQTLGGSMHLEINMISAYTSKKDSSRTNATKEETEHLESKATIHNHHNHPYDLIRSHEHNPGTCTTNGSPRSSSNDLMRPGHPLFAFLVASVSFTCIMSHCMSHCTCSHVSYFQQKKASLLFVVSTHACHTRSKAIGLPLLKALFPKTKKNSWRIIGKVVTVLWRCCWKSSKEEAD